MLEVANTIAQQLGHSTGRMVAMIGAYNFVGSNDSLSFRFKARARNGANACRVTLTPADLYKVEFISCRGMSRKVKGAFDDVYAEDLKGLFERETGLYLSL